MSDDLARGSAVTSVANQPDSRPTLGGAFGGGGGGANFGELVELMTSTIKPESWDETGGPGTIKEYTNGVYVDPAGVVRPVTDSDGGARLTEFRRARTASSIQAMRGGRRRCERCRSIVLNAMCSYGLPLAAPWMKTCSC